ncbi:zinc finger CCCH domain-containing protein 11A [Dendrobates tinctorius]|uniref:zinc finger CCCH domain-containing protein 11A n=1 Tax=Dendrobates tinctorius TaxID=92724 RepID=UPI003CC97614
MSNQGDDCYFFFYSTCTKGDGCAFRHSEAALGNETVCTLWKEGRCFRQICKYRHMEIDKKRSEIACYWENQISGCQKANCAFHHTKGRFVDGAYFPPNKASAKPEPCEPDVQTSLPSPAPAKLSVVPTPQLRGVKKMEATENVPSPTHPPVVINAADDDEDDDDQFSEGEEMKNSSQHSMAPGNQQGIHTLSTRKSVKKAVNLNYGIKTLKELKSEKHMDREVSSNESTVSSEIFVSSYNQADNSISFRRTVKFTNKDLATNLSLAQRLGKHKKFQGDSPLAASDGEVVPSVKKSLSERLGKRTATPTDSPERLPKKVQISRPLKDRLGLQTEQGNKETEIDANTGIDFHIKTLQEIRQEKASQRLDHNQNEDKVLVKSKPSSKPQTAIYIKSLSEIRAEKRLRQLKNGVEKCETLKDEKDSIAVKALEQKTDGSTAQPCLVPPETTQKQTGFNWKVQGERQIKRTNDNISSNSGTTKPLSVSLHSIEKVRVKTLEEIRQEKALRLQQTAKSENVESASRPPAPAHHRKILRLPKLTGRTDAKKDQTTDKLTPAEETTVTIRSSVKMSNQKEQIKKNIFSKMESSTLISDSQVSAQKHGSKTEMFKPTPLTLEKREKPKLNVEPCVVKNALPVKVARKQKAQERTIVAEVKPMSSALTCSKGETSPVTLPVSESSEEPSGSPKTKHLKLSPEVITPLPSSSAAVPLPVKSPRTSTASIGKAVVPTEDEFDEMIWEIDDKLDAELDLDSNKDEDALLLELSKMIDS